MEPSPFSFLAAGRSLPLLASLPSLPSLRSSPISEFPTFPSRASFQICKCPLPTFFDTSTQLCTNQHCSQLPARCLLLDLSPPRPARVNGDSVRLDAFPSMVFLLIEFVSTIAVGGGIGWTGPTCCPSGWSCQQQGGNIYYSQCLQGAAAGQSTSTVTSSRTQLTSSTKVSTKTTSTTQPPASTSGSSAPATGFLGGLNLAGFDFGMTVWGWSGTVSAHSHLWLLPLTTVPVRGASHFADRSLCQPRCQRLPHSLVRRDFPIVMLTDSTICSGWQYMESSPGAGLNSAFFSQYDAIIQATLKASTAPYVILDLHNYGRWNSGVVGKDGPTSTQFAALWGALAKKYASNSKIMFGLMNEPHDMSIGDFKASLQAAVNAIRAAGAKTQYVLLPGTDWTHASSYLSTNKAVLTSVTDPAGGTDKLIMDFHQYLDQDGSGTNRECVTDHVSDVWEPVAKDLRATKRKAIVTEIGGASTACTFLAVRESESATDLFNYSLPKVPQVGSRKHQSQQRCLPRLHRLVCRCLRPELRAITHTERQHRHGQSHVSSCSAFMLTDSLSGDLDRRCQAKPARICQGKASRESSFGSLAGSCLT